MTIYRTPQGREIVADWCHAHIDRWTEPHTTRWIETAAGRTHLLEAGTGSTVLLLPGNTFNAAASLSLTTALARQHHVVVADLPGQPGLSAPDRPEGDVLEAYGSWAGEVARAITRPEPARRPILVGHSLGAAVALAADPAVASGLVLVDPAGLIGLKVSSLMLVTTIRWLTRPSLNRSNMLLRRMLGRGHAAPADIVEWMTLVARHTRPSGAPDPLTDETTDRWRRTPLVALSGAEDCFLPPQPLAAELRHRFRVPLQVLTGTGHLSPEERPGEIADAVQALLQRS